MKSCFSFHVFLWEVHYHPAHGLLNMYMYIIFCVKCRHYTLIIIDMYLGLIILDYFLPRIQLA